MLCQTFMRVPQPSPRIIVGPHFLGNLFYGFVCFVSLYGAFRDFYRVKKKFPSVLGNCIG
ncbi:hypothetical protein BS50DRAFT_570792 [Corynespora cassiicola Philippines]|uniref:Uncharacterized protein n=1 Tax=Corynespora cassiicola Philippines TaxID=1448308 RepID=A0A2T2P1B3_CORCC|nr:hypothetical protein BS50DRAFT_570792 [Corynespora cassiicola Philippines]